MKKLFVLPAIVLALAGLLVFTACPDGKENGNENGGTGVSTTALTAAIQDAKDAMVGVQEASKDSEVATGLDWVTTAQADELLAAIGIAEAVLANPQNQSSVNAAESALRTAISTFTNAKRPGNATAITLSGTITVKNLGQTVPFVVISAHDDVWDWRGSVRLASSGENTSWEIKAPASSEKIEVAFRVEGFSDANYTNALFSIDVRDLMIEVQNENVTNIVINLANLRIITLSGTINIDGETYPSLAIQARSEYGASFLGETSLQSAGNNTSWSIKIEAFDDEAEIAFYIVGFDNPIAWRGERLLELWVWGQDFGITVKDQNMSGIALNFITLSGTIDISYDGESIPYAIIEPYSFIEIEEEDEYGEVYYYSSLNWLGDTKLTSVGNNTPWSIIIKAFDDETDISFRVIGLLERVDSWWEEDNQEKILFEMWPPYAPDPAIKVKDKSIPNIVLDLGDMAEYSWY